MISVGFARVSKKRPCRICSKPTYCGFSRDEGTSICMRISTGSRGLSRNGGNIHVHPDSSASLFTPRPERQPHKWQEQVVRELTDQLQAATQKNKSLLNQLIQSAYDNLSRSINVKGHYLPLFTDLSKAVYETLDPSRGQLMITKLIPRRK